MADIKSFPNNQDVYIGAEPVMRWLHGRTSGVFGGDGNLAVEAVSGSYAVTVSDGTGWMSNANGDGIVFWVDNQAQESQKLQLAPEIADQVLPRIDRVVVTWETTDYVALPTVTILKGTAAFNPKPPSLTNNTLRRQISLARIRIPAGASSISSSMITDERLDSSVCGIVTGSVSFDTTVMQAQFEELLSQIETELDNLHDGTSTMLKSVYDPDDLGIDLGIQLYTHSKSGRVHVFRGSGKNGIAKITAPFNEGDVVWLNGYAVDATCGADEVGEDTFVEGQWVSFIADQEGGQINFRGGGGLSSSKLAAANTAPGDVRTGKKFFAGDKTIKTGTLPVLHMGESHQINRWQDSMTKEVFIQANTIPEGIYESDGNPWSPQVNIPAELFGNAADSQVLAGVTFTSQNGAKIAGTMANRPGHQETKIAFGNGTGSIIVPIPKGAYLNNGESRPDNYDNSQNSSIVFLAGTATPDKVLTGNRFCSAHGVNIEGTMPEKGAWNGTYSGSDVIIPNGHHSGTGKVSVSGGNRGAWGTTINPGASVTIPQGYHNGRGVVKANGNSINFHPIDRTIGWGSGIRFTGEDATPGVSGKMHFVLKYWCRTEYNVNGYIKVLRNGSEIHSTTFNKTYDSPYNDDAPNGYINVEFSGSGTYQIQVSVDYSAGNGEIKMGGAFIGY